MLGPLRTRLTHVADLVRTLGVRQSLTVAPAWLAISAPELVSAAVERARRRGATRLVGLVAAWNRASLGWAEHLGWKRLGTVGYRRVGRRRRYFARGSMAIVGGEIRFPSRDVTARDPFRNRYRWCGAVCGSVTRSRGLLGGSWSPTMSWRGRRLADQSMDPDASPCFWAQPRVIGGRWPRLFRPWTRSRSRASRI